MKTDDLYLINEKHDIFLTANVRDCSEPILTVVRYEDDCSWGFFSRPDDIGEYCHKDFSEILNIDPSLFRIGQLKPGQRASRNDVNSEWTIEEKVS